MTGSRVIRSEARRTSPPGALAGALDALPGALDAAGTAFPVELRLVFALFLLGAATVRAATELNLFGWSEYIPQPVIDGFSRETGIKVNVISAANGLEQRIKTEGANSPADVLLTVDISRLEEAVRAGITQPSVPQSRTRLNCASGCCRCVRQ